MVGIMNSESGNQNIVNFAFVAAGFMAFLVVNIIFETAAGMFGPIARMHGQDLFKHGLPVVIGVATFLMLFLNKRAHVWADECVVEIRKVVWPSRKDTVAMTIVCCVMVIVAGIGLSLYDLFASQLIKLFVN